MPLPTLVAIDSFEAQPLMDFFFLALTVAFVAAITALVCGCDALRAKP